MVGMEEMEWYKKHGFHGFDNIPFSPFHPLHSISTNATFIYVVMQYSRPQSHKTQLKNDFMKNDPIYTW
jgi:hypothetical protein